MGDVFIAYLTSNDITHDQKKFSQCGTHVKYMGITRNQFFNICTFTFWLTQPQFMLKEYTEETWKLAGRKFVLRDYIFTTKLRVLFVRSDGAKDSKSVSKILYHHTVLSRNCLISSSGEYELGEILNEAPIATTWKRFTHVKILKSQKF